MEVPPAISKLDLRILGRHKLGIYTRGDKGEVGKLRAYCDGLDWRNREEYLDNPRRKEHPQFERLLKDVQRRKIQLLVFWRFDQLPLDGASATLKFLSNLNFNEVFWRSHDQELENFDVGGDAMNSLITCLCAKDRWYRLKAARRRRAGRPMKELDIADSPPNRSPVLL
jgi:DNA invertase Pin-like site-specific DNA recombinase